MKFNKIKLTKRFGGGGSGGGPAQTVQNIPPELMPYIKNVMSTGTDMFNNGQLNQVAGSNSNLNAANALGGRIGAVGASGDTALADQGGRLQALATSGGYDTTALKDKAILDAGVATADLNKNFGQSGTLGSARQAVMQGSQNAATAAAFAGIDKDSAQTNFQNKMAAEQGIGANANTRADLSAKTAAGLSTLGNQERNVQQQQADASWQGLQRLGSTVYGTPARQTQEQSQSKGGK